jgi:hypothetical protein
VGDECADCIAAFDLGYVRTCPVHPIRGESPVEFATRILDETLNTVGPPPGWVPPGTRPPS